jgi:hypothetical protein
VEDLGGVANYIPNHHNNFRKLSMCMVVDLVGIQNNVCPSNITEFSMQNKLACLSNNQLNS